MFFDSGGNRQDVGVENDVLGGEAELLGKKIEGAFANAHFFVSLSCLTLFVKRHHDSCSTVAANQFSTPEELFFAIFQADRIDDRLTLNTLEACFEDFPFGAVNHDGHCTDVRLPRDEPQVFGHRLCTIQQGVIHVDIDHARAALNLIPRDLNGFLKQFFPNQASKLSGARHIGPLTNHQKVGIFP